MTRESCGNDRARVVITLPRAPSRFAEVFAEIPDSGVIIETHEAFLHLSRRASSRLVIVSPFLDEPGVLWAISMFESTPASRRILLCREYASKNSLAPEYAEKLRNLNVNIRQYALVHENSGRFLWVETFHAKIVLADQVAAYVGSANFLRSSKDLTLECGVMLEGRPVRDVHDVVQTMIKLSSELSKLAPAGN